MGTACRPLRRGKKCLKGCVKDAARYGSRRTATAVAGNDTQVVPYEEEEQKLQINTVRLRAMIGWLMETVALFFFGVSFLTKADIYPWLFCDTPYKD